MKFLGLFESSRFNRQLVLFSPVLPHIRDRTIELKISRRRDILGAQTPFIIEVPLTFFMIIHPRPQSILIK